MSFKELKQKFTSNLFLDEIVTEMTEENINEEIYRTTVEEAEVGNGGKSIK